MDPLYHFREWSEKEAARLMKDTGTIEDVDGEYSLRISGKSPRICQLPPHYRIALHALNKRCGLYKKIAVHLKQSSNASAPTLRNMYLSLVNYMHNVRIAFVTDASYSSNPLDGRFRSPALDYYLWLDHKAGGFHSQCREILANDHHVTFDDVKNGISADILALVDWGTYHSVQCNEHDICGAIQGFSGKLEDLQHLFSAIESSMNVVQTPSDESTEILHVVSNDIHVPSAPAVECASIVNGVDRDQGFTFSCMDKVNSLEDSTTNIDHDVITLAKTVEPDVTDTLHAFYPDDSHTVTVSVVEFGDPIVACEQGLNDVHSTIEDAVIPGCAFLGPGDRGSSDANTAIAEIDNTLTPRVENELETAYTDYQAYALLSGSKGDHADISMTPDVDIQRETTGVKPQAGDHNISMKKSDATQGDTVLPTCGAFTSPHVKTRLRPRKKDHNPSAVATNNSANQQKQKHKSPLSQPGRPVLYARNVRMHGTQVLPDYTMEKLLSQSWMSCNVKNLQPLVISFLLDPKRDDFIASNIRLQRGSLSTVASCVASLLKMGLIQEQYKRYASTFMSIDLWLEEVADECKISQDNKCSPLQPLAHQVFLELSYCATKDEMSLRQTLQKFWVDGRVGSVNKVLLYWVQLNPPLNHEYTAGFRILISVKHEHHLLTSLPPT